MPPVIAKSVCAWRAISGSEWIVALSTAGRCGSMRWGRATRMAAIERLRFPHPPQLEETTDCRFMNASSSMASRRVLRRTMLRPSLRTLSPFARIAENALGEEEAIAKFVVLTRRSHGHGDGRGEIAFIALGGHADFKRLFDGDGIGHRDGSRAVNP
jgi:hypothetical protein